MRFIMNALARMSGEGVRNQIYLGTLKARCAPVIERTLLLLLLLAPLVAAQVNEPKRVLLLMQEDLSWPIFRLIDENVRTTLRNGSPGGVLFFSEHMDLLHFPDETSQMEKRDWIQRKYADTKLDLVVGAGEVPTDLFPNVPLVYIGLGAQSEVHRRVAQHRDAGGVRVELGVRETLSAARQLQPKAQQVLVIVGSSPAEKVIFDHVREQFAGSADGLTVVYLSNLRFAEILNKVRNLGTESIVLFATMTRDADGLPFISAEAIGRITAVSGAPVYTLFNTHLGSGAMGGYVVRFDEAGKQVGEMGLQLLAGGHPRDEVARSGYIFDWRQLQHWNIPESALPAGSLVMNRRPTPWENYGRYILGAIIVFLLETMLILGLLWQRARKRKFQKSLLAQMGFERILADLSTTFIHLPEEQIGANIEKSLGRIAEYLKVERISIFQYSGGPEEWRVAFSWHNGRGQPAPPPVLHAATVPRLAKLLQDGETVLIEDPESLPGEASAEKEYFRKVGAASIAILPLKAGDELFGAISFATANRHIVWTEELVGQLKLLAEILSNALMRKRAQEARFRHTAIVESSDDAIISKDLDGIILSWNPSAQRLFGYSAAEAVGQPISIIIPDQLRGEEDEILRRSRAGEGIDHYETVRHTKDGRKLPVSLTLSPLRDSSGKIVGVSKIARDITEQKLAEEALRKSEERFRLFMDHSPAWIKDAQGHYIYMSESYLKQLDVRVEDRRGKTDFELYPREIAAQFWKNDQAALAGQSIEVTEESIGPNGEPRTWLTYKFPFQDASGKVFVGAVGVDITEQKKSEETLHNLTGRLITAQEEERSRIARELHDDFSQRLALLAIGLGQHWKRLSKSDTEERASVLELLRAINEIASDIHALSRELHSSKLEHVGLGPALRSLCKELGENYKIQIQYTEWESPVALPKAVALCLFRVAQGALTNVVKHSQCKEAEVTLGANDACVCLRVTDHGAGFDPDLCTPGTGIGLIGMSERLRLVGGMLLVKSEAGRGTEISAEVPLAAAVTEEQARTQITGR
jgi:PAS domain S-box-containing protein